MPICVGSPGDPPLGPHPFSLPYMARAWDVLGLGLGACAFRVLPESGQRMFGGGNRSLPPEWASIDSTLHKASMYGDINEFPTHSNPPLTFDAPSLRLQLPQGAGAPPTRRSLPVPVHREDEAVRVAVVVGLLVRLVSRALEVLVLVLLELALELVESVLVVLLALLVVLLVILLDVLRPVALGPCPCACARPRPSSAAPRR